MQNLEIKAWYPDPDHARAIIDTLPAPLVWTDQQIDTYFVVPNGRLKLRQSLICGSELICYQRPDATRNKISEYQVYPTQNAELLKTVLTSSLGIRTIVKKMRSLYLWQRVRIHLDLVENLGSFIEFEAPVHQEHPLEQAQEKVQSLMLAFEIAEQHLHARGYAEMMDNLRL